MNFIDIAILVLYILSMLGIGIYFMNKNSSLDDYYVGGRSMGPWHIGLSVVATDVGGGFSIGLGGLGFVIGVSGSWMLFTGLIGAWLSAVFLIPKIKQLEKTKSFYTLPELFGHFFNNKVAFLAAIISVIGYIGFTSSQLLAGAKLASASFSGFSQNEALLAMGALAIVYTAIGGIKAVIYTDTIQWIVLMSGLFLIGIPLSYIKLGGMVGLKSSLSPEYFSLANIRAIEIINWMITIVPIWFVGMTLYQRIYACPDEKTAKKAWFIAGVFEYPLMAFMGVLLGMFAKAALLNGMLSGYSASSIGTFDPELGLPLLIKNIFPIGLMGLILAAYLSAVLSTADSCLMAASGSFITDVLPRFSKKIKTDKEHVKYSQIMTFVIGGISLILAWKMKSVLSLMLSSYSFMVSGLFVPILFALFTKNHHSRAALSSMFIGGSVTLILQSFEIVLPFGLDANFFGILSSAVVYLSVSKLK